jgi:hypothetical protein
VPQGDPAVPQIKSEALQCDSEGIQAELDVRYGYPEISAQAVMRATFSVNQRVETREPRRRDAQSTGELPHPPNGQARDANR